MDSPGVPRLPNPGIANVSNTPALLYPGRPIGQLVLLHVNRKHDPASKVIVYTLRPGLSGVFPFKNPEEDLLKIGIRRTSVIRKGTVEDGRPFTPEPAGVYLRFAFRFA